ncbi:hypothetical protein [Streptomyces sp. SD15]
MPQVGDLVFDEETLKVGRVADRVGPYWQLKPPGGGREWDAHGPLRLAAQTERLSCDVALANARSRGRVVVSEVDRGWRDGTGGVGRLQAVVSNAEFVRNRTAWRAYIDHSSVCQDCVDGLCPEARRRWRVVKGRLE